MIKIIVIDDDKNFTHEIKKQLSKNIKFETKTFNKAEEGLKEIYINKYDILVLDLVLPTKDGFYVLDELKRTNKKIKIIVLTSCSRKSVISQINEYDVSYYMLKPIDYKYFEKIIINIHNSKEKNNIIENRLTEILHLIGIPSNLKGYKYLKHASHLLKENNDSNITKDIYPEIAKKFKVSIPSVERAIRHAIDVGWIRGNLEYIEKLFGSSVDFSKGKPTNSELLETILEKIV